MKVRSEKKISTLPAADLVVLIVDKQDLKPSGSKSKPQRAGRSAVDFASLNAMVGGALVARLSRIRFEGKPLQAALLDIVNQDAARPILFVGAPPSAGDEFERLSGYRKCGSTVFEHAKRVRAESVSVILKSSDFRRKENAAAFLEGVHLAGYSFDAFKSEIKEKYEGIKELSFIGETVSPGLSDEVEILCHATIHARDLVNLPAKECTPGHLVEECKKLAKSGGLSLEVFDKKKLEKMGAGGLLGVSQGSDEPPYLIKLTYKPKKRASKIISIVGKGVTFDSGGLSIKPGPGMETMKDDMSGAAAVIGAMEAISKLKPKVEVRAYIPTTENMINGKAMRPGDVLRAMNGKTIEVLNTDAEGRLILADALSLAEKDKCDVIIDLATLTGACVVALGPEYAALFSTDEKLSSKIMSAGIESGERFWPMPLAKEYRDMIKSPIADIKNTGGRWGGAITAALFLKEFVKETPWAHLDIAGPAFSETQKGHVTRGGVGFAVRTLARFLCRY